MVARTKKTQKKANEDLAKIKKMLNKCEKIFYRSSPPLSRQAKAGQAVKVARAGVDGKDFWRVSRVVRQKEKILTWGEG